MWAIWSLVSLSFLNPAWTSGSSQFTYCWSLTWRILSITLLVCEMSAIVCVAVWTFFGNCFSLELKWKLTFSSNVTTAEFSKFAGILRAAASFRTWNSSAGIPSPPLALFVVMFPKAHLTSDSRMSDSRWLITPSWLSGSLRSFLYSSSVYPCHLFLISSASLGPYHFCPLLCPSFHSKGQRQS